MGMFNDAALLNSLINCLKSDKFAHPFYHLILCLEEGFKKAGNYVTFSISFFSHNSHEIYLTILTWHLNIFHLLCKKVAVKTLKNKQCFSE